MKFYQMKRLKWEYKNFPKYRWSAVCAICHRLLVLANQDELWAHY